MTTINTTTTSSIDTHRGYLTAPVRLVGLSLGLGWLFEWAFFDKPQGLSAFMFVLGLLGMTVISGRFELIRPKRSLFILAPPLLFFAAMLGVRSNDALTFFNMLSVLVLLMMWAHYFSAESPLATTFASLLSLPFRLAFESIFGGISVAMDANAAMKSADQAPRNLMPILRGVLLALPILIVFTALLGSADLIFAQRLESWFDVEDFDQMVQRILLVLTVAWLTTGALAYAMTRGQRLISAEQRAKAGEAPRKPVVTLQLGFTETTVVLTLVNLLFAAFVTVQFAYLFGGARNISIEGYTYAEYARRGFFEMVAVSVLSLGLILLLNGLTKRNIKRQTIVFNALSTLTCASVTVMLISAHQRLSLYELTYGYSFLRIQSHTFILWLAIAFGWVVLMLWLSPSRIAIGLLMCGLGFVAHLNLINPDALIVRHNFERFEAISAVTGDAVADSSINVHPHWREFDQETALDTYYWTMLSDDAIPMMLSVLDELPADSAELIRNHLENRGYRLYELSAEAPWQSTHLAREIGLNQIRNAFTNIDFSERSAEAQ